MEKAADAFRTISEVADDLSLPQHVLRFWETRFPQIRPLKRAGGRRYYRPGDVTLLRAIRQLLYDDGYTIKGVQRLLKEQGAKGLGTSARAIEDQEEADLLPLPEGLGVDPLPEPTVAELGGPGPAGETGFAAASHRQAIEDAIAMVEECRRLLVDALEGADKRAPQQRIHG